MLLNNNSKNDKRLIAKTKFKNLIIIVFLFIAYFGHSCQKKQQLPNILSSQEEDSHYIPDFSYAGYHWGEDAIPNREPNVNVADYGAVPDDRKDDTEAIKKALEAAHKMDGNVVLSFPPGRFIVKDILYIQRSNFVLRGAGSGRNGTSLYFPKSLNDLPLPEDMQELEEYLRVNNKIQSIDDLGVEVPYSLYAWTGGFIWTRVKGKRIKPYMKKYNTKPKVLAQIENGVRGEHILKVNNSNKLNVGDIVSINWYNTEGPQSSLIDHIYDNQDVKVGSRHWDNPNSPLVTQEVTITEIENNKIHIKSPLMHDIRPEWKPVITEWKHIEEVGIENLSIDFPYDLYNAHHVADGYNAIFLTGLAHSWVRNVKVNNGDNCLLSEDCANVTIQDVETTGRNYHYTIEMGTVYNMLAENITVNAPCLHSLSFNTGARRCVFTNCDINIQPTLDQHSGANMQNLFDNISMIDKEPFHSFITGGGAGYWKPSHGAFSTFWNIQIRFDYPNPSNNPIKIEGIQDGPSARLVGVNANYPVEISYGPNTYKEGINQADFVLPSLYEYQLEQRIE